MTPHNDQQLWQEINNQVRREWQHLTAAERAWIAEHALRIADLQRLRDEPLLVPMPTKLAAALLQFERLVLPRLPLFAAPEVRSLTLGRTEFRLNGEKRERIPQFLAQPLILSDQRRRSTCRR